MIEEIVRKAFVEQRPISSTLHLFGVATDDVLGGLTDIGQSLKSPSFDRSDRRCPCRDRRPPSQFPSVESCAPTVRDEGLDLSIAVPKECGLFPRSLFHRMCGYLSVFAFVAWRSLPCWSGRERVMGDLITDIAKGPRGDVS